MATDPGVLIQAHIQHARLLVLSPMDILDIHKIVDIAKTLNPEIQVLVCAEKVADTESEPNRRIAAAPLETRPKLKNSYGVQRTLTLLLAVVLLHKPLLVVLVLAK